jgi:hypothetical protein
MLTLDAAMSTLATPDNLERSGKLFRVLAFVIRDLNQHSYVQIRPKSNARNFYNAPGF